MQNIHPATPGQDILICAMDKKLPDANGPGNEDGPERNSHPRPRFSRNHLEMAMRSANRGFLKDPDGYGKNRGQCADTVEMYLKASDEWITEAAFEADGCGHTVACCNTVVSMARGRRLEDAWKITPEKVAGFLETLPPDHYHCAELTVGALYRALADLKSNRARPWKKLYRTTRSSSV